VFYNCSSPVVEIESAKTAPKSVTVFSSYMVLSSLVKPMTSGSAKVSSRCHTAAFFPITVGFLVFTSVDPADGFFCSSSDYVPYRSFLVAI